MDIPGYAKAVAHEGAVRDGSYLSFLNINEYICGVPVMPLSILHFLILDGIGNPFIVGGKPSPDRVAQFLWTVSTEFKTGTPGQRDDFIKSISKIDFELAKQQIADYVSDSIMDAPAGAGPVTIPQASFVATLVDAIASEYHWAEKDIVAMPLKRVFQYIKLIQRRNNPSAPVFNPSDKVKADYLKIRNAKK